MKSKYIYPTKRNILLAFIIGQILPFILLGISGRYSKFLSWMQFELVILGCLALWQLKPMNEFDEREKEVSLKWKSRTLDYAAALVVIPIIILSFHPEIEGWTLYNFTSVPIFIVFIFCSLMTKREIGYFYIDR